MKYLILSFLFCITINLKAQDNKTVTLTVIGQGQTIDEAKVNALRSAIEQAFGTFVSTNTTILDDKIIKDEIISISNGNIQKYDIINETLLPNGTYSTILKAIVSINKLIIFCESKGVKAEFKGNLFAINMIIQDLNKQSELKAWESTKKILYELMKISIEYKIKANEPTINYSNKSLFDIPITVDVSYNENYKNAMNLLLQFCKSVSLSNSEIQDYIQTKKNVYQINILKKLVSTRDVFLNINRLDLSTNSKTISTGFTRNLKVANDIARIPFEFAEFALKNFKIINGIDTLELNQYANYKVESNNDVYAFNKTDEYGVHTWQLDREWNINLRSNYTNTREMVLNSEIGIKIYNGDIFSKVSKDALERYYTLILVGKDLFLNFYGIEDLLQIQLIDIRSIDEIKKINEFKIQKSL